MRNGRAEKKEKQHQPEIARKKNNIDVKDQQAHERQKTREDYSGKRIGNETRITWNDIVFVHFADWEAYWHEANRLEFAICKMETNTKVWDAQRYSYECVRVRSGSHQRQATIILTMIVLTSRCGNVWVFADQCKRVCLSLSHKNGDRFRTISYWQRTSAI